MKIFMMLVMLISGLAAAPDYIVTEFGAVGDGLTVNTVAVQAAIDAAFSAGGGRVVIPTGVFVSGTLVLKSNVELHLTPGAVLLGSTNLQDYVVGGVRRGLIFAVEARNITLSGSGIIDGNGTLFFDRNRPHWGPDFDRRYTRQEERYMDFSTGIEDGPIAYDDRPGMLVVLLRCEQVIVCDLTFRDSPSWTFRIGDCDGVLVHGISILNNLLIPNSDGVHCTTSRNIRISDCDIRAGDDCIIVSGFGSEIDEHGDDSRSSLDYVQRTIGNKTGFAENIVVTNCTLQSRSAGIRVGYGQNPIRNCLFNNLVIYDSNRGLGVFARDAGSIQNIQFDNITIHTRLHTGHWWGAGEPIHVSAIAQNKAVPVGTVSDIRFTNIIAESEAGIVLYGTPVQPLQRIELQNVTLTIVAGRHTLTYGGNIDLRPTADLKDAIFRRDLPGILAQDILDASFSNVRLRWGQGLPAFFTHGIEAVRVESLRIDDFSGTAAPNAKKANRIALQNCRKAEIE